MTFAWADDPAAGPKAGQCVNPFLSAQAQALDAFKLMAEIPSSILVHDLPLAINGRVEVDPVRFQSISTMVLSSLFTASGYRARYLYVMQTPLGDPEGANLSSEVRYYLVALPLDFGLQDSRELLGELRIQFGRGHYYVLEMTAHVSASQTLHFSPAIDLDLIHSGRDLKVVGEAGEFVWWTKDKAGGLYPQIPKESADIVFNEVGEPTRLIQYLQSDVTQSRVSYLPVHTYQKDTVRLLGEVIDLQLVSGGFTQYRVRSRGDRWIETVEDFKEALEQDPFVALYSLLVVMAPETKAYGENLGVHFARALDDLSKRSGFSLEFYIDLDAVFLPSQQQSMGKVQITLTSTERNRSLKKSKNYVTLRAEFSRRSNGGAVQKAERSTILTRIFE